MSAEIYKDGIEIPDNEEDIWAINSQMGPHQIQPTLTFARGWKLLVTLPGPKLASELSCFCKRDDFSAINKIAQILCEKHSIDTYVVLQNKFNYTLGWNDQLNRYKLKFITILDIKTLPNTIGLRSLVTNGEESPQRQFTMLKNGLIIGQECIDNLPQQALFKRIQEVISPHLATWQKDEPATKKENLFEKEAEVWAVSLEAKTPQKVLPTSLFSTGWRLIMSAESISKKEYIPTVNSIAKLLFLKYEMTTYILMKKQMNLEESKKQLSNNNFDYLTLLDTYVGLHDSLGIGPLVTTTGEYPQRFFTVMKEGRIIGYGNIDQVSGLFLLDKIEKFVKAHLELTKEQPAFLGQKESAFDRVLSKFHPKSKYSTIR